MQHMSASIVTVILFLVLSLPANALPEFGLPTDADVDAMPRFTPDQKAQMKAGYNQIRRICGEQWPTNVEKRTDCQRQQIEAIRELSQDRPDDISPEQFSAIGLRCLQQATDDFAMRAACQWRAFRQIREGR